MTEEESDSKEIFRGNLGIGIIIIILVLLLLVLHNPNSPNKLYEDSCLQNLAEGNCYHYSTWISYTKVNNNQTSFSCCTFWSKVCIGYIDFNFTQEELDKCKIGD